MPTRLPLSTAAALLPDRATLHELRVVATGCRACDLWQKGTQTVFGAGRARSELMLVGEQPGNDEDLAGEPFVGPAGRLLDKALIDAGIERSLAYVTNVVKHFKWEPRGKRRIHSKPNAVEITACLPWLQAEIRLVEPKLVVCLGATAAQALLGKKFRVTQQRGEIIQLPGAPAMLATIHPSAILRSAGPEIRAEETNKLVNDLIIARKFLIA